MAREKQESLEKRTKRESLAFSVSRNPRTYYGLVKIATFVLIGNITNSLNESRLFETLGTAYLGVSGIVELGLPWLYSFAVKYPDNPDKIEQPTLSFPEFVEEERKENELIKKIFYGPLPIEPCAVRGLYNYFKNKLRGRK